MTGHPPVLMTLTLYKRFKFNQLGDSPLVTTLCRDGVIYMLCITRQSRRFFDDTTLLLFSFSFRSGLDGELYLHRLTTRKQLAIIATNTSLLIQASSHPTPHFSQGKPCYPSPVLKLSLQSPQLVTHSVLASRILFNLRAMSDLQDVVTDGLASLGSGVVSQPMAFGTPTCVECVEGWDFGRC
jgi:hypothetical protein